MPSCVPCAPAPAPCAPTPCAPPRMREFVMPLQAPSFQLPPRSACQSSVAVHAAASFAPAPPAPAPCSANLSYFRAGPSAPLNYGYQANESNSFLKKLNIKGWSTNKTTSRQINQF